MIHALKADITTLDVDAVVNAANPSLEPGGGVCGAIYAAAGPRLEEHTRRLTPIRPGEAVATPGFDLPARFVIHAAGPVWRGGSHDEAQVLRSAYESALRIASEIGCRSIALPFISAGIYGYPKPEAAAVAVSAVREHLESRTMAVVFCLFSDEDHALFCETIGEDSPPGTA